MKSGKTINTGWHQLKRCRTFRVSFLILVSAVVIALLAPVLANDKPLYINFHGHVFFPALSGDKSSEVNLNGKIITVDFTSYRFRSEDGVNAIYPLVRYAPGRSDFNNSNYVAPGAEQLAPTGIEPEMLNGLKRHLLGTGKRGDDLLSGLIYGARISLTVGISAMLVASILGILLGAAAGYFGDSNLKVPKICNRMLVLGIVPAWFYAFSVRHYILADALRDSVPGFIFQLLISILIFSLILFLFFKAGRLLSRIRIFSASSALPVDSMVSRTIEVLVSLPRLILILSVAAIARPSLVNLILIIGLTSWTEIARLVRAETLRIKNMEFIESARSLGLSDIRIIIRHVLPNAIAPASVAIVFGIASAILAESSLSFLGIGIPQDTVSWGALLNAGRENYHAWWMVVFPGTAIFLTVLALNLIGEKIRDAFDPRLKN